MGGDGFGFAEQIVEEQENQSKNILSITLEPPQTHVHLLSPGSDPTRSSCVQWEAPLRPPECPGPWWAAAGAQRS